MLLREKILKARKEKGLTQLDLSRALGYKSVQFISLMEIGRAEIPLKVLGKLCFLLKLSRKEIIESLSEEKGKEIATLVNEGYRELKETGDLL